MSEKSTALSSALLRCGMLAAATVGLWILLAAPAWSLAGRSGLEGLTFAAVLCLVPGCLVFAVAARFADTPSKGALVVLGGTVVRMLFVLIGVLVLKDLRPDLGFREFVVWLLAFYLATLLVETLLAVRMSSNVARRSGVGGA
jgi:hypothetical protein